MPQGQNGSSMSCPQTVTGLLLSPQGSKWQQFHHFGIRDWMCTGHPSVDHVDLSGRVSLPLIESLLLWSLHSHPSVVLQAMHLFKIMLLQALQLPQGCLLWREKVGWSRVRSRRREKAVIVCQLFDICPTEITIFQNRAKKTSTDWTNLSVPSLITSKTSLLIAIQRVWAH